MRSHVAVSDPPYGPRRDLRANLTRGSKMIQELGWVDNKRLWWCTDCQAQMAGKTEPKDFKHADDCDKPKESAPVVHALDELKAPDAS